MKPSALHTIVVGDELPLIVKLAIEHNKKILIESDIEYVIHQVPRDKKYFCAGLQTEILKLKLLSAMTNIIVCDWDIWIEKIPDMPISNHIFFGFRRSDGPDFFLVYTNDLLLKKEFFEILNSEKKYVESPGFTKVFADRLMNRGLVREFPFSSYCHFESNCGLSKQSFSELPIDNKFRIEQRSMNNIVSWFRRMENL